MNDAIRRLLESALILSLLFSPGVLQAARVMKLSDGVVRQSRSALTEDQRQTAYAVVKKALYDIGIDITDTKLTVEQVATVVRANLSGVDEAAVQHHIDLICDHISTAGQLIWALPDDADKVHGAFLTSFYADRRPDEKYRRSLSEVLASAERGHKEVISLELMPGLGDGFTTGPTYAQMIWQKAGSKARKHLKIELETPGFTHGLYRSSRDINTQEDADYAPYTMVKSPSDAATARWRSLDLSHFTGMPSEGLQPWAVAPREMIDKCKMALAAMIPMDHFPVFVASTMSSANPVPGGRRLKVDNESGTLVSLRDLEWSKVVALYDYFKDMPAKPYLISLSGDMNPVARAEFNRICFLRTMSEEMKALQSECEAYEAGSAEYVGLSLRINALNRRLNFYLRNPLYKASWDKLHARYNAVGKGGDRSGRYSVIADRAADMVFEAHEDDGTLRIYPQVGTFDEMVKFIEFSALFAAARELMAERADQLGVEDVLPVKVISCDTGPANLAAACKGWSAGDEMRDVTIIFNGSGGLSPEARHGGCNDYRWTAAQEGKAYIEESNLWSTAQHLYTDGNLDEGIALLAEDIKQELS